MACLASLLEFGPVTLEIVHSCCPGKRDIAAPAFKQTETMTLKAGIMLGWTCEGCKTVIYTLERHEETTADSSSSHHTRQHGAF